MDPSAQSAGLSQPGWSRSRSRIKKDVWRSCPAPDPSWGPPPTPTVAQEARNSTWTLSFASEHQLPSLLPTSTFLPEISPLLLLLLSVLPPAHPNRHAGGGRLAETKPSLGEYLGPSASSGEKPQFLNREHPPTKFPCCKEDSTTCSSSCKESASKNRRRGPSRPLQDLQRSSENRRGLSSRDGAWAQRSTVASVGFLHQVLGSAQLGSQDEEATEAKE